MTKKGEAVAIAQGPGVPVAPCPPLHVLTLNCWGLWLISKQRTARINALASFLASAKASSLDIVCLQEIWNAPDADQLISAARTNGLSHAMHFTSGTFGTGLVTLSRHPFTDTGLSIYSAAGDPLAITCGDFYAAKGVGWVRVLTPSGPLDVFNTHLHANYSHKIKAQPIALHNKTGSGSHSVEVPLDGFAPYRISQVWQLTQYVQHITRGTAGTLGVVLAGDLNAKPNSLEMALLRGQLPDLRDSWQHLHTRSGSVSEDPAGFTCSAPGCTYTSIGQVPERIDFVLSTLLPLRCEVTLKMAAEAAVSYSDHFAVQAELGIPAAQAPGPQSSTAAAPAPAALQQQSVLEQSLKILDEGVLSCRQAGDRARKASGLCLLICLLSIGLLVTPSLGPALPWGHSAAASRTAAATALETLGMVLLLLATAAFSALSVMLLLKAHIADASQERALRMSALGIRVKSGLGAGGQGRKGAAAQAAGKAGASAGDAVPAAAGAGKRAAKKASG